METWTLFKKSINDLTKSDYSSIEIKKKWNKIIRDFKGYRPNHLKNLFSLLDESNSKFKTKILDHGCGSGITLFFSSI